MRNYGKPSNSTTVKSKQLPKTNSEYGQSFLMSVFGVNCFKYKEKTYEIIKIGLDKISKPIFISICLPNDLTRVDKFELENLST